jgi:hypothetical protein
MLFACLFFVISPVEDSEASYCDKQTYVFFGNGMFNEQSIAASGLRKLKRNITLAGDLQDDDWKFELSYNHNEGATSLLEVFRQRMGDQTASYWRWLGNLDIAPDWFQSATRSVASGFDLLEAVVDEDLRRHIQRYEGLLMAGNRVLVVAHSQGSLYANAAHTQLAKKGLPMDAFGIVSVANPASRVAGDGPYFTLLNDLVIYGVSLVFPNTLPGNIENTIDDKDWTHHNFIDAYLNGDQSGPLIVDTVLNEAEALSWPEAQVGRGPISVTLTWGEQPDVDLHIFEPNWSHVYYADPIGESGHLDHDDTSAYGPEHYYVGNCDQLETGRYGVAVNYYRGSAPETAHIQIQAGDIIRDFSTYLFMAYGSSGNSRARTVASIDVIDDPEQGYVFKVNGF